MITSLSYFLTVAKHGSITRAAEELYISQPALSAAIIRLENKLNTKLLDRSGHSISLTPAGKLVQQYAAEICSNYEKMCNDLCLLESNTHVTLRCGSGLRHVVSIADNFMCMYPSDNILVMQYNSFYELKKALLNQEIDICISAPPVEGMGVETRAMCTEALCAIFHDSHPFAGRKSVSLEELAASKLMALPDGFPLRMIIDDLFQQAGLAPKYIMQAENNALTYLLHQSKSTDYVTLYPLSRCRELHSTYADICYTYIDGNPTRTISVSWLDKTPITPQIDRMLQYIAVYYADEKYSRQAPPCREPRQDAPRTGPIQQWPES